IYRKVRAKMIDAFGGNLHQLIIGGAALAPAVEQFLLKIKFPYTVGYGMTECAPLISYCFWDRQKPGSCGLIVDRMEGRVESADPATVPGVLWVKGDNVMQGYYKNAEATEAVFRDGWMSTGDICILDNDGYLFIKGRDKSMILGPSGQNIYPEEIENKLNHLPFVAESIVVERDGKLVALVYPDEEAARHACLTKEKIDSLMDYNLSTLNRELPGYSKVSSIELRQEPFEKTPKQSIKRYLYK
ncbi:MAG: AMP-binding protein, partial [Muribaculaceae bacterium]|nr:AMP-binding protein [Muribaculaceae bacterium]